MLRKLTYLILSATLAPALAMAEVTLDLASNRSEIFLGESFNITLSVNGADENIEQPVFGQSGPAEITFLGSHSNSRSSIQIINGRVTRDAFRGRVLSYAIKPEQAGAFSTGPVTVKIGGRTYTHKGVAVNVKGIEKQDSVIVSVQASSTSVLVEEPFEITLSVAVKELPDPYWKNNEPVHPGEMPHLQAGFLEITDEKDGLSRPDLNSILNGIIDQSGRQPAFRINTYQSRGMGFGSFFDEDPFRARPIRFRLSQKTVEIDGQRYREYSLKLPYRSTAESQHTFGPVTFKGKVIANVVNQGGRLEAQFKEIYTIGPAVTVRVIPPPDEGRPEEFIGSVGKNISAVAQLDTNVCKVGDPLTLTLEITGDISVSNMRTPILNLQPELTRKFRIYDENVKTETLRNGKRFTYRVRPTEAGTLEFPPVRIAYYDTGEKAYKIVATAPLPLQAEHTTQISAGDEGGGVVEVKKAMPFPCGISLAASGTGRESLMPEKRTVLLLSATAPLLTLLILLAPRLNRAGQQLRTYRKRSGALSRALRDIQHAESAADLSRALREWFSDRLELSGQSLTAGESAARLAERHVPPELCEAMRATIAELDEAMYRPDIRKGLPKERCREVLTRADSALNAKIPASEDY